MTTPVGPQSDPLAFLDSLPSAQQPKEQSSDPLGFLDSPQAQDPLAFLDKQQGGVTSLAEANAIEDAARQKRVAFLTNLLQKPGISPRQRARIEDMLKRMKTLSVAGIELTNPKTESRLPGSNLLRGVGKITAELPLQASDILAGLAELPLQAVDILAGRAQVPLNKKLENLVGIPQFRKNLADAQAWIKGLFDPQGKEGLLGQGLGLFLGPTAETAIGPRLAEAGLAGAAGKALLNPFGILNSAGMRGLVRVPVIGPKAAAVIARGTIPGASFAERLSAQVIGSSSLDAAVAADVLTDPNLDDKQKAAALLAVAAMSGGSAAVASAFRVRPTKADLEAERPDLQPPPGEGVNTERAKEATVMTEAAKLKAARVAQNARIRKAAKADWEARHPGQQWKSLGKDARRQIVAEYRTKVAPADTNLDNSSTQDQLELALKDLGEMTNQRDEALRQANTDALTGYGNKDAFERARPAADADPSKEIVFFDVKNFKAYNDSYGNVKGDELLKDYSKMIETATRATGNHARIFRQGDEFFVIAEKGTGEAVGNLVDGLVVPQMVGDFQIGLRNARGNTFEEASLALTKVKGGEVGPKSRPGTVVVNDELKIEPKATRKRTPEELAKDDREAVSFRHGTEPEAAVGIIKTGLRSKSSVDTGGGLSEGSTVVIEFTGGRTKPFPKGDISSEGSSTLVGGSRPKIKRILFDAEGYEFKEDAIDAFNSIRQALDESGQRDVKIEAATFNDKTDKWEFGGKVDFSGIEPFAETVAKMSDMRLQRSQDEVLENLDLLDKANNPRASLFAERLQTIDKELIRRGLGEIPGQEGKVVGRVVSGAQEAQEFRQMVRKPLESMTDEELVAHRNTLSRQEVFPDRLKAANEELARRARPKGFTLNARPEVTGAVVGFAAGLVTTPDDSDQSAFANALYYAAAGALITHGGLRLLNKARKDAVPAYQAKIREKVKSVEDRPLKRRVGGFTHLMRAYEASIRRDIPVTNVGKVTGSANLPGGRSSGKLAELFGLWRGMSDRWLFGDRGPGIFDSEGNWVQFPAITMQQIASMVDGDLRTVGDLAAAARELELRAQDKPRTTGLNLETARVMFSRTPEKYHQARIELTKFFRAMADLGVFSGLISKETRDKFDAQTYYVALRRVFDGEVGESSVAINTKGGSKKTTSVANLFKFLKGSERPFQNPAEAAIDILPRHHRASELNRLALRFFDELAALSPEERKGIATPISKAKIPKVENQDLKVKVLRKELEESGTPISGKEAEAIIASLSDESLNVTSNIVRFYRNGEVEAWRVSDPLARAFKALQPHELDTFMAGMGMISKVTNFAKVGITANPVFVGWQAFRDIWQFHQNGSHGIDPGSPLALKVAQAPLSLLSSGAYSLRGYLEIMFRTGNYRDFLDVGTGGESIASQGLRVVRGDVKSGTTLLSRIKEPPTKTQFGQIFKEIKQGSIREAYASILQPIADAGRVGAFLHERGRGHDVIEAVYRAKKAGANWANRGSALSIQALNRMTLFLNPSLQGLDASRFAFQKDPTGYIARGIIGITLPSIYLWAAYRGDEEIKQLRTTPQGKRFWWMRINGQIVRIPKPIFDGQVFGTLAESAFDKFAEDDPEAINNWVESMWNDASVNLLPFIGVVPISMATGKVVGLGSDIVPQATQGLDVTLQARPESSTLARITSKALAPIARNAPRPFRSTLTNAISPAGLDFMTRQLLGTGRAEAARALSIAIDVQQGHDFPPKEELPFIRSAFGKFPSLNVGAIREFYSQAGDSEEVVNTVNYLASHNPEQLPQYLESNLIELTVAKIHSETRKQLSDLRKAIEDIREAPPDVIKDKDRRLLTQSFMESMIELARNANLATREIKKQMAKAAGK